ncbi:MAG TPA: cell wall hydrolase [Xanthobacteraceae bacterium]|nr:cell wall hydrolase [Xanthobacteraceae bacterium]
MFASRAKRRPFAVHFGIAGALLLAFPTRIAQQDLASLLTYQAPPVESTQGFFLSFSALRTATFSLPRPAGIAIPELPVLQVVARAGRDADPDITGSIPGTASTAGPDVEGDEPQITVVNRAAKGDLLVRHVAVVPPHVEIPEEPSEVPSPTPRYDIAMSLEMDPGLPKEEDEVRPDRAGTLARLNEDGLPKLGVIARVSRLFFFRNNVVGSLPAILDPGDKPQLASAPASAPTEGSTTLAAKGEVTGEEGRPKSPAERLGIKGPTLAKAEKCLADAIYFESRGETKQGQTAVAQVVVNRAFSGFYPSDICGVVYQNANRYLACQFTFACEGKKLVVDEPDMWEQAKQISHDMLDGRLWLDEIGKATHYHAYWVHPDWIREMRKINRIGVHTFYRPKAWEG